MWARVAQGSVNGPNVFGRLSALAARMTQALVSTSEARLQQYIDDPCTTITGTEKRRKIIVALFLLFWRVLGWDLSTHKAQQGEQVDWIGFNIHATPVDITAQVKAELMEDFKALLLSTARLRWISQDDLRSFTGKANHIANVLCSWRPFISDLWAPSRPITRPLPRAIAYGSTRSRLS